jgi:hypothetical protein
MKQLLKILTLYLATNCFKTLLEKKEIDASMIKTLLKDHELLYESFFRTKEHTNKYKGILTNNSKEKRENTISLISDGTHQLFIKKYLLGKTNMYLYILEIYKKQKYFTLDATIKWYDIK